MLRKTTDRATIALHRAITRRRRMRALETGGRRLPELASGRGALVRVRKVAVGAALVAVIGAGGAGVGYSWGHDAGEQEANLSAGTQLSETLDYYRQGDVCRAEAVAASKEKDGKDAGYLEPYYSGKYQICRKQQELRVAQLAARTSGK